MSLDLKEFHRSLKTLDSGIVFDEGQTEFTFPDGHALVGIVYEALENATLGGLLALPRAKVTLNFSEQSEAEQQTFLARFDKAFQRGGG